MLAMNLLKRVLPFLLTLIVGAALVSWFVPRVYESTTLLVVKPPQRQLEDADLTNVFRSGEVTKKAVLLARPEPNYTSEARQNGFQGTVRLRAILASSGEVTNIQVVSGAPFGLTEQAIDSARRIEFTPAVKDGRAVSQYVMLEYSFNLY